MRWCHVPPSDLSNMDVANQVLHPHQCDVQTWVQLGFTLAAGQRKLDAFDRTGSFSSILDMHLTRINAESGAIKCTHGHFFNSFSINLYFLSFFLNKFLNDES